MYNFYLQDKMTDIITYLYS